MKRSCAALTMVGLAASGCSAVRPPLYSSTPAPPTPLPAAVAAPRPTPIHPLYRCAPDTPCAPKERSVHRQYYDTHHRRYYYFDPVTRRYYWEDGQPKT